MIEFIDLKAQQARIKDQIEPRSVACWRTASTSWDPR